MTASMLYIQALSPIHVGMGQGAGVIDLPVIRETVTGWPYLPGSSIKGVLRDACAGSGATDEELAAVFGPPTENASDHAGGVIFADQRLLCLPVRTYAGGFAWVTCPLAVRRWLRDADASGVPLANVQPTAGPADSGQIVVLPASAITSGNHVWLEDLKLEASPVNDADQALLRAIAEAALPDSWRDLYPAHAGIVTDTVFSFLSRTATEVMARNRIDPERKIVADGALWWEEAAPAETIFAGPLVTAKHGARKLADGEAGLFAALDKGLRQTLQIGGNATVGRGLATARRGPAGGAE